MVEPRGTFDEVADLYDRVRPTYPPELFDALFSRLGPAPVVLEVGPGTGQATRALLARGARVTAVEPGANLRRRLRENLPDEALEVVGATFEEAVLAPRSFDALVSATAYHWVDAPARTEKPARVLRPGGWIAVIDLIQVDAPSDRGFFARVQDVYRRHESAENQYHAPSPEEARNPVFEELASSPLYGEPVVVRCRWDQTYSSDNYADLMRSYSVVRVKPAPAREALIGEVCALIDAEFGGEVTRPLVAAMTLAPTAAPA